jgi:hypothetical protein
VSTAETLYDLLRTRRSHRGLVLVQSRMLAGELRISAETLEQWLAELVKSRRIEVLSPSPSPKRSRASQHLGGSRTP